MRSLRVVTIFFVFALFLSGCGLERGEVLAPEGITGNDVGSTSLPYSAEMGGYILSFEGRDFNGETTTFNYTVSGVNAETIADMFFLEVPECATELVSYTPGTNVYLGTHPNTGTFGLKWEDYIYPQTPTYFSMSYDGDVPLGTITTAISIGEYIGTGEIAGPCKGAYEEYEISGAIFIDADADGVQDNADVSGINEVTIRLNDGNGGIFTFMTGPDGLFDFMVPAGTYVLSIPTATAETDFNEQLAATCDPTTSLSRFITVGPDSPDNLFGFDPRTEEITADIIAGNIVSDGMDSKFWVKLMRAADHGKISSRAMYTAEELLAFLNEIEGLFLDDPFQFTPGNEFAEAVAILKGGSPKQEKALIRELLTAELNHVSGRGMIDNFDLQVVMLSWVEEVVYDIQHPELNETVETSHTILKLSFGDIEIDEAISFLESMNGAIGGGSGGDG